MNRENIAKVKGSGSKWYNVSFEHESQEYQCSCPAWTHSNPRKPCKHVTRCVIPAITKPDAEVKESVEGVTILTPQGKTFRTYMRKLLAESGEV